MRGSFFSLLLRCDGDTKINWMYFALDKGNISYNFVQENMQEKNSHHIEIIINNSIMNRVGFIA